MKKLTQVLLAFAIGIAMSFSSYGQETVYVIADLNANPNPIYSYGVTGNTLTLQATQTVPDIGGGAVGLAMDEANGVLFVCYEFSNTINMINATNMTYIGSTNAPGASNLSGLAFDPGLSKLYATDRMTNHFYSFTWDPVLQTLTNDFPPNYLVLPGLANCWDIALDHINGILYCGDASNAAIRYYNVGVWGSLAGSYSVGHNPIGVDIDIANQILYTTGGWSGPNCSKYVIGGSETMFYFGGGVLGVAANQSSGVVYLTFYSGGTYHDNIAVMEPLNGTITWNSGDIGNPTAVLYTGQGYNPLALTKTVVPSCFTLGQDLTYTISFTNGNPSGVTGVIVTDTLPPNTTFVSATGGPTVVGNVVTWNVGALNPGAGGSFTLIATVNSGNVVDNIATIRSDQTGVVVVTKQTPECIGPVVPLADWAIYIVIVLIGVAVWFRFRK